MKVSMDSTRLKPYIIDQDVQVGLNVPMALKTADLKLDQSIQNERANNSHQKQVSI